MSKIKPKTPEQLDKLKKANKTDLCLILKINRSNLYSHLRKPDAPQPNKKKLYPVEAVKEFVAAQQEMSHNGDGGVGNPVMVDAKTRRAVAQAEREERKNAEEDGELINIHEVIDWIFEQNNGTKKRLLAAPAEMAPKLVRKTRPQAFKILTAFMRDIITDIAEYDPKAKKKKGTRVK